MNDCRLQIADCRLNGAAAAVARHPAWVKDPICSMRYAELAGAEALAERVQGDGPILYCRTQDAPANWDRIRAMTRPIVLVTAASDEHVTEDFAFGLPANVRRWFTTNLACVDTRIEAIPLGLADSLGPASNHELLVRALDTPRTCENLMYVNFTRGCHPRYAPRAGLYEYFGGRPWVTCRGGRSASDISRAEFYGDLRAHPYVLSPEGWGPDCHRHWEAILLGAIPIVTRSIMTETLLAGLPALIVDSLHAVDEAMLAERLPDLLTRFNSSAMARLGFAYWRNKIEEAVSRCSL